MNDSWNDDDYNQLFVITADVDWAVVVLAAIWDVKSAFDHTVHLAKQLTKQVTDAFWFFFHRFYMLVVGCCCLVFFSLLFLLFIIKFDWYWIIM